MPEANWRDALPEEIRGEASLANFQDIGQLAKSYMDMKSYQGSSIHIPGEDAGDEQRQAYIDKLLASAPNLMVRPDFDNAEQSAEFYQTLGVPSSVDGYEMPNIEKPEGAEISEDRVKQIRDLAHELNLTKSQFTKFVTKMVGDDLAEIGAAGNTQKSNMEELKKEWGQATEERIAQALDIAEKTKAPDHLIESIKSGNAPADMLKWVQSVAVSIGTEGNNLGAAPASDKSKMTPFEAQEKIREIYDNKQHPFHKGDKLAMEHMVKLVSASSPDASKNIDDLRAGVFG